MSQEALSSPSQPPVSPETPRRRIWFPFLVAAAAALAIAAFELIESSESLEPVALALAKFLTPFLLRVITLGLSAILIFLWLLFFSPFSRAARFRVAMLAVLAVVAFQTTFKVEGYTGDIRPRLRLRWAAPPELPQATEAPADLTATTSADYPEFLGTGRRATLAGVHLARDWSTPPRLLWRQPIGEGWSSFAVVGNFAVTQEQRDQQELVTCYEVDTGKLRWAHSTPARFSAALAGVGPRATPTIHEGKVYALGALGHLACLDGATGKPIWQHDIVTENGARVPQWGMSGSPLVYENAVIVSAGGAGGKSLVAYDKHDGKPLWSAGDDASSYSSPTVLTLCGQPQIVILNERYVTAHDPVDGHVLWQHVWPDMTAASPNVSQPIAVGDDRVLLCKGYGVGSALWQIKRDGDRFSVEELWRNNNLKTKMTNAVVREDFAYGLDEGVLSCLEIATGAKKWKKGKYGHGQVLLVDDLLLVQSEQGEVALVEASPKSYRELARFSAVEGQSWNYPALTGRKLLVRTEQEAACYELPSATPGPPKLNATPVPAPAPEGMAWIPGGWFWMGDNDYDDAQPEHLVYVDGFWLDKFEVTNAEFARFVAATGYQTVAERPPDPKEFPTVPPDDLKAGSIVFQPPSGPVPLDNYLQWWAYVPGADWRHPEGPDSNIDERQNHPAVHIAWPDAMAYANWAGKRLPTEAEWELAARGRMDREPFCWGHELRPKNQWQSNVWQGNFPNQNTASDGFRSTAPVGSFAANAYGLFDMSGNVWEWCSDWYRPDFYQHSQQENPQGPDTSFDPLEPGLAKRVQRGGSFMCSDVYCRRYVPGSRGKGEPSSAAGHIGFRCARSAKP